MARPPSEARQTAEQLASAGVSPAVIRSAIGDTYNVPRSTFHRIMQDVKPQLATLESSLSRLKRIAIRCEAEGNQTAAIAAHRAIRETLRELRLAQSYADLEAGEDTLVF